MKMHMCGLLSSRWRWILTDTYLKSPAGAKESLLILACSSSAQLALKAGGECLGLKLDQQACLRSLAGRGMGSKTYLEAGCM